jgi:hypothetical protein
LAKKRFISSILLCAFAVIFAHSIIPHHHHDEVRITQHSNQHDDDQDDLDNNFLGQAFSHFQHESNNGITYQTASPTFQCSQFSIDKEAVLVTQYFIRQLFKPPIIHKEHSSFAFTPSAYSASSLFRGPPMA